MSGVLISIAVQKQNGVLAKQQNKPFDFNIIDPLGIASNVLFTNGEFCKGEQGKSNYYC